MPMGRAVECAICESRFKSDKTVGESTRCPHCRKTFEITESCVVKKKSRPSTVPVARPATTRAGPPDVSAVPSAQPVAPPLPSPEPANHVDWDVGNANKRVKSKLHQRRKKSTPVVVLTLPGLLALALASAIALPFALNGAFDFEPEVDPRQQAIQDAIREAESQTGTISTNEGLDNRTDTVSTLIDPSPDSIAGEFVEAGLGGMSDNVEAATDSNRRTADAPPVAELTILNRAEFDDVWRKQQGRIVRLVVKTALGRKHAIGTIVDTRGWVVTSFRAVAGAKGIDVVETASDIEEFNENNPLTDQVRGVIAVDRERDIVVLSINPRFVQNLSSTKLASEDNVVGSEAFAQFYFHGNGSQEHERSPLTASERIVTGRKSLSSFSETDQASLRSQGLKNGDMEWIEFVAEEPGTPGAPVIDMDGVFQAFVSGVELDATDGTYLAYPAKYVADLIVEASPTAQPLDVLSQDLVTVGMQVLTDERTVDVDHPLHESASKLNQIMSDCREFSWLPADDDQYRTLQVFLFESDDLREALQGPGAGDAEAEKIRTRLEEGRAEFEAAFDDATNLSDEAIEAINRNAAAALEMNEPEAFSRYVIAHSSIALIAMDSYRMESGDETQAMRITGHDLAVYIPYSDELPVGVSGSNWIITVKLHDEPVRKNFMFKDARLESQTVDLIRIIAAE